MNINYSQKIKNQILNINDSVVVLLQRIQKYKFQVIFVVDEHKKYIGTISEGDFRRYVIQFSRVPKNLSDIVNTKSVSILESDLKKIYDNKIEVSAYSDTAIIDKNKKIVGIFSPNDVPLFKQGMPRQINVIAPARVSFSGGGSDLDYWFKDEIGCVVNLAIRKYARVTIRRNFTNYFNIVSLNTGEKVSRKTTSGFNGRKGSLDLIFACLATFGIRDGLDIDIYCDFEPGTGLGGSSSLVVAVVYGISRLFNRSFTNKELIHICYDIERNVVGILGGWQDQIAAVTGGLCVTHFQDSDFGVNKIDISDTYEDFFSSVLFLVSVGANRDSSQIHGLQKAASETVNYKDKMKRIVNLAKKCSSMIGQENLNGFGEVLDEGWQLKKSLGEFISSPEINCVYDKLKRFGATGGRLLGAGGSGYLLVYVQHDRQIKFISHCRDEGFAFERVSVDPLGVRSV